MGRNTGTGDTPVGGLPEAVGKLTPDLVLADSTTGTLAKSLDQFLRGGLALPSAADCRSVRRGKFFLVRDCRPGKQSLLRGGDEMRAANREEEVRERKGN